VDSKIVPPAIKLPLKRDELPDDIAALKDGIMSFAENIEYLKSELTILRRFQYGQSSERKKKA
jgi:hypothetical protein